MMRLQRLVPILWAISTLFVISGAAVAKGKGDEMKVRHYGIGHPKTVQDLPNGKLRRQIEGLPAKARGKALGWLQSIEFPVEDTTAIHVTAQGDVYYADTVHVGDTEATPESAATGGTSVPIDEEQAFALHSRPGSANVLYLDFNGQSLPPSAWYPYPLEALPFDPSNNDSPATVANFTQDELNRIHEIWHRIAEDYAPFDIDVTTEEPSQFTNTTGHIVFTHDVDALGYSMPSAGAGGTAFIDVFGSDNYALYSPAFVYYTNLSSSDHGLANYCADAASHEFGHNLGLTHDGVRNGAAYYEGHGDGLVSWAPIMGSPYYKNVTQWSQGEYPEANNPQDDLALITGKLGYVADDHGNSSSQASALTIESNGDILVSSPEIDPDNALDQNKGIIEDSDDSDWFYFDVAGPGTLSLTATPAWHSFPRDNKRGANLDIALSVLNGALQTVAYSEPTDDTMATVSTTLAAGRYYVLVDGMGSDELPGYSDYASLGMYFIEGIVDAEVTSPEVDITAPTPGTMSWQSAPTATGQNSATMTAVLATDASGTVEYLFTCVAGGAGCRESDWQSGRTWNVDGLAPGTYYAFNVRARDLHGNINTASASAGFTTDSPPVNQAPQAVIQYTPDPAQISKGKTVTVSLDGSASFDPDGTIAAWSWRDARGDSLGNTRSVTTRLREGTHHFTLAVTDDQGAVGSANVEIVVSEGDGSDDGDTGTKPTGKPPKKK